jgi:hypothetical protein
VDWIYLALDSIQWQAGSYGHSSETSGCMKLNDCHLANKSSGPWSHLVKGPEDFHSYAQNISDYLSNSLYFVT